MSLALMEHPMRARENAQVKARRYLAEGRLSVTRRDSRRVEAIVRGDGVVHRAGHDANRGWWCTCPALTSQCSHLVALRLVVVIGVEQ